MDEKRTIIIAGLHSFSITSGEGAPENQYRIRNKHVEFRSLALRGRQNSDIEWRVLDPGEVQLHFALHTPVADWLDKRLYSAVPKAA